MKSILKVGFFSKIIGFFRRLGKSVRMTTSTERLLLVALAIILLLLIYFVAMERFVKQTALVPEFGGEYKEALVGDVKYLTPYAVKTDAEKSISTLIYSGLIGLNSDGEVVGDLAKEWSMSESGLEYRFELRENVIFHDGASFEASDVLETVNYIKNPENKSPLYENWRDVEIASEGDYTIIFTLPQSYGPFIFYCTVGIVNRDDLLLPSAEIVNGTGPFSYIEMINNVETGIKTVSLQSNEAHYFSLPYIQKITFDLYESDDITAIDHSKYIAFAGFNYEDETYLDLDFELGRNIVMFANLRREFIANSENRAKIFGYQAFEDGVEINIVALDNKSHKNVVEEFIERQKDSNVDFQVDYLSSIDYADRIIARDYDLLFYGCNFGYDRDLYAFWHSSQQDFNNFSGYSDKDSDIFLEDTRFASDALNRNSRYDQFCQKLKDNNLAKIYPAINFNYKVNFDLKGVENILGKKPEDRFNTVNEWYLVEKRVKK